MTLDRLVLYEAPPSRGPMVELYCMSQPFGATARVEGRPVIEAGRLRTRRMNFGGDPSTTGVRRPPNSRDGRDAAFQKRRWSPCGFLT